MIPIAEYTFGQGLLTVLSIFVFMAWILGPGHDPQRPLQRSLALGLGKGVPGSCS